MTDRLISGATCGLGLAIVVAAPSWQLWLAAAVVVLNLGRLVFPAPRN